MKKSRENDFILVGQIAEHLCYLNGSAALCRLPLFVALDSWLRVPFTSILYVAETIFRSFFLVRGLTRRWTFLISLALWLFVDRSISPAHTRTHTQHRMCRRDSVWHELNLFVFALRSSRWSNRLWCIVMAAINLIIYLMHRITINQQTCEFAFHRRALNRTGQQWPLITQHLRRRNIDWSFVSSHCDSLWSRPRILMHCQICSFASRIEQRQTRTRPENKM